MRGWAGLRLEQQLTEAAEDNGTGGGNELDISSLDRLKKDQLRESFATVKQFKGLLTRHYHITM